MKDSAEDFVVESTPVLDLKKHGLVASSAVSPVNEENWDSDRTEVYADVDGENAMALLIGENGESYPITTFPYVMGRGSECDLVLQGKGVSRRHAEIIFQSGRFVVNDLESLNGLKVNGYKVARVILEENDVVKLGDVALVFHSSGAGSVGKGHDQVTKGKKGIFTKKDSEPLTKFNDNTFGPSLARKLIIGASLVATVGVVSFAGYQFFMQQSQPAGRIVESASVGGASTSINPPKSEAAVVPAPMAVEKPVGSMAPDSRSNVVDEGIAPPPSIAPPSSIAKSAPVEEMSGPSTQPEVSAVSARVVKDVFSPVASKSSVSKAVASKPAVAVKKDPVKAAPQADVTGKAKSALANADSLYFQGQAEDALIALRPIFDDVRVSEVVRQQARTAHSSYSTLFNQYMSGQAAFNRGDKESAFQQWTAFMNKESSLFSGRKSSYTRSISSRVVDEYVTLGNEASRKGDHHTAYRNWQKALDLGDSVAAKIAIDNTNNRAMQLYRQALRLEYVNTGKARSLWQEVTELLPPGTEYNTKASAKLAWYDKWGS